MRSVSSLVIISLICVSVVMPQGRPVDWPSYGGDARRSGWQRSDLRITKDNVKEFQFLWKRKLEGPQARPDSLTPPVVIGLLISYRGFKELGFVANNAGDLWSIDVDLNRVFWQKRFAGSSQKANSSASAPLCSASATTPALTPPMTFGGRRRPSSGAGTASPSPGQPPTTAGRSTELPLAARVGGGGFGAPRPVYILSSDGKLHQVNTSDGSDQFPPLDFLPANAKASSLTMQDYVIYTTTSGNCSGAADAVWAIDLANETAPVAKFALDGGDASGLGGFALGNDGVVYVQTGPGSSDPASNKWSNTLLALSPRDVKLKSYFTPSESGSGAKSTPDMNVVTPVVFDYKGRDLIVSAGNDGRLYLLDSQSVGGEDHKTSLHKTSPLGSAGGGIWGGLSTWEEDGVRWVAAPVWGPVNPELKVASTNGAAPNGSVIAFRVEEQGGKTVLTPAWASRDLSSPVPPVITSGLVFALSTGAKNMSRAILYALDAVTGKEMYSSGNQVTSPGNLTGLTVANGRVFFTTSDSTLYAFGIYFEI
jgi:hypothetical protein